jgi:carboxylate-amine ligase
MSLEFKPSQALTLGVEIEVQLIDWRTRDLCPAAPRILERLGGESPHIKAEIFQSMMEVNTGICKTVAEARRDLDAAFSRLRAAADSMGVEIAVAGTHPFARYDERILYPAERYRYLLEFRQWFARRLLIFGQHVHVGMRDGDHAIAMMNAVLPYLPYLLALSSSSPFWQGEETGLASARTAIFEAVPNGGAPSLFSSWQEFAEYHAVMSGSRSIESLRDLWWDIRPSPGYGTLELRIFDGMPTLREMMACVALTQCLLGWLDEKYLEGQRFAPPPLWQYRENKWRAVRWGPHTEYITSEKGQTRAYRAIMDELLQRLEPTAARFGCEAELRQVDEILRTGVSTDRQRACHDRFRSMGALVEMLVEELRTDECIVNPGKHR